MPMMRQKYKNVKHDKNALQMMTYLVSVTDNIMVEEYTTADVVYILVMQFLSVCLLNAII